jgi:hypothetical protein
VPWLPMYLYGSDVDLLVAHLDEDDELAWLVSAGPGAWAAHEQHPPPMDRRYGLWHVPSGPLPLLAPLGGGEDGWVDDPWKGWTERRQGADAGTPYFGPGHPGVYWLNLRTSPDILAGGAPIGLSSFEWAGNRYRVLGRPATKSTERHWRALRRWVGKQARRIPRTGPIDGSKPEIYAFPRALEAIHGGLPRAANP